MKHIAVILNHTDQVSRLEPYLLGTARPGSQIVFLVLTKARRSVWLQAQMTALAEHHSSAVQVCENRWRFELSHEKQAAERKLSALRSNLLANGVENLAECYRILYLQLWGKDLQDFGRCFDATPMIVEVMVDSAWEQLPRVMASTVDGQLRTDDMQDMTPKEPALPALMDGEDMGWFEWAKTQ